MTLTVGRGLYTVFNVVKSSLKRTGILFLAKYSTPLCRQNSKHLFTTRVTCIRKYFLPICRELIVFSACTYFNSFNCYLQAYTSTAVTAQWAGPMIWLTLTSPPTLGTEFVSCPLSCWSKFILCMVIAHYLFAQSSIFFLGNVKRNACPYNTAFIQWQFHSTTLDVCLITGLK